ncbi:hypothetical protein Pint_09713 [Pistacia integerrima]|uniref:Uncharacterized protein n=1 Tax=Pistacia integerrima TaxID=434235 RepID=A0ACC0XJG4_9ROSI|nr:hypothetical protein Pint_09713 [Pistacia integerrima]
MFDPLLDIDNLLRYSFEYFVYDPHNSPKDEPGVLKAVQNVHAIIDKEVAAGTDPKNVSTPILWSHGTADRTVLFVAGQAGPPLLEQAGISCEFKAYPGLGHFISKGEFRNLESWIKSRLSSSS